MKFGTSMGRNQAALLAKKESLAWKETTKRRNSQPVQRRILAQRKDLGNDMGVQETPVQEEQPRTTTQQIGSIGEKELLEGRTAPSKAKGGAHPGQLLKQQFQEFPRNRKDSG